MKLRRIDQGICQFRCRNVEGSKSKPKSNHQVSFYPDDGGSIFLRTALCGVTSQEIVLFIMSAARGGIHQIIA
jgi:hypothetical protein